MTQQQLAELLIAAKGAVIHMAETTKAAGGNLTQNRALMRLNEAILAFEGLPSTAEMAAKIVDERIAARGGRMDMAEKTDA